MKNSCDVFKPTESQVSAREIMGRNMFGIEDAIRIFGICPTASQLGVLAEVWFTGDELLRFKDSHVLVAVFPISILAIRDKVDKELFFNPPSDKEEFAKNEGKVGWYLIRKTPVEKSMGKSLKEQQAFLSKNEEAPTAQVMVYAIIGHLLATGERLFRGEKVRCLDEAIVGFVSMCGGLHINDRWDVDCNLGVGLASARLPFMWHKIFSGPFRDW